MARYGTDDPDPRRFLSLVEADEREDKLFQDYYQDTNDTVDGVAGLRRRRRRVANDPENPVRAVTLVEEDGTLYWRDGVPARASGREAGLRRGGRRRSGSGDAGDAGDGSVVLVREFVALKPNRVVAAVGALDVRLNKAVGASLRSTLRPLRQTNTGAFELGEDHVSGPFAGRTLLLVHGTFSNAAAMLSEFTIPGGRGLRFLDRAMRGPRKYDRVLFLEHPTLSVSPVINALELGRAFAGSTGQIDVVAHSRGGLVVRWWLEAFGSSLGVAPASPVRAVLVGSPLNGTSLAAPDRIQRAMSLVSNIGSFADATMKLAAVANPFLWVAGKLIEVVVSVTGTLAKTPLVDALSALVPGLAGQSRVGNNHEINRLREGPAAARPAYYAVVSDFETEDPGWRFWRNFRRQRIGDLAADYVFPGRNDLVVDTESMTDFGVPTLTLAGAPCDFRTSDTVWHCNYFRQDRAIDYLAATFRIVLD